MTVVLAFACPRCAYEVDAVTGLGPDGKTITPKPGDFSLCLVCGAPLELQADAPARWLTYAEFLDASVDNPEARALIVQALLHIVTMRPSRVRSVRRPPRRRL